MHQTHDFSSILEEEDKLMKSLYISHADDHKNLPSDPSSCVIDTDIPFYGYVDICGVLVQTGKTNFGHSTKDGTFIFTPRFRGVMRQIGWAVSQGGRGAILIEGPTGSGKTALVRALAERTKRSKDILVLHLAQQTDPKMLLGSYLCTEIPGEFKFQPGPLAQAVKNGSWLLLEDIHLAPMDVLSVLLPLLETHQLFIPGRAEVITAAPGFRLFATQTMGNNSIFFF